MNIFQRLSQLVYRLISIALFVVFSFTSAYAQEPGITERQISWQSLESKELHSGESHSQSCTIVTYADQKIDLLCGNDSFTYSIEKIIGTWTDPALSGSLTYLVSYQEMPGKIVITRTSDYVEVFIDFTEKDKAAMKRKFIISQIN